MEIKEIKKLEKNLKKYVCEKCDFKCYQKCDWDRHILRAKHLKKTKGNPGIFQETEKNFFCKCGNSYKTKSGLWKHSKVCKNESKEDENIEDENIEDDNKIIIEENELTDKQLIIELLKQNNDFKQMLVEQNNKIMELAKEGKYITNNTTNNNFNLNIFLNEKCKDALDLMDFVETLQLKINDLEETARLGYAEGISKIFMRGLKQLDIYKRPIHCSDLKREILYIKDKNVWEKEDDEKKRLVNAIKIIGNKNIKQIPEWQKLNPEYRDPESKQNDKYMNMLLNVMSGGTEEEQQSNMNKIIRNVVKEVVIDKRM